MQAKFLLVVGTVVLFATVIALTNGVPFLAIVLLDFAIAFFAIVGRIVIGTYFLPKPREWQHRTPSIGADCPLAYGLPDAD